MHMFCIDKKIDYSAPILFKTLSTAQIEKPHIITQKTTAIKQPVQKTTLKSIATNQKKATTIASQPKKDSNEIKKQPLTIQQKPTPVNVEPQKNIPPIHDTIIKAPDVTQNIIPTNKEKINVDNNARISHNYREVEALRRGAQLQKELVNHWHPPLGVSPNCTCDISFFVTKQGKIEHLKTTKSSGVMMFDISARQALFSMKMPPWTYGKPLMISFKQ